MGEGGRYPRSPREIIPENVHVHVNEQSALSLWRRLRASGFHGVRSGSSTPEQHRSENAVFRAAR